MGRRRNQGEHIEVTFRIADQPFLVMPVTVVDDTADRIAHYLAPGTRFLRRVLRDGSPVPRVIALDDLLARGSRLRPAIWQESHRLIVTRPGRAHAVYLRWRDPGWTFEGWYVNLQEALQRTQSGFSTQDQFLDLVVKPDLSWRWKDEVELDLAVARGRLTVDEAMAIRAEGEWVIEHIEARAFPFDGSLIDWRPDSAWPVPGLSERWGEVIRL